MLAVKYEKPVQRFDSIQALRGIAAMLVLIFHIAEFQQEHVIPNSPDYQLTLGFWNYGYNGVDLFFVISGFIMVYVTHEILPSFRSARHFLWSRITRIYPLWWVCAAIMTAYFYLTYGIPAVPDLIASRDEAWSYAVKSFLLLPMDTTLVLGVGWTLIHEMFFYLIFTASLIMARKNLSLILCIWAGLVVIVNSVFGPNNGPNAVYNLAINPMSLEFIAGAFAAMVLLKYQRIILPKSLCWITIVSVISYMAFMMSSGFELKDTDLDLQRTLFYALPFACLVFAFSHLKYYTA